MLYRNSFFQYAVGVLVATPILWGLMATSAIGDGGHHHLSGGLTIGGPGDFIGKDGDPLLIHSSETARTLCVTLAGKKGTMSVLFDLAPVFEVTKHEEKSVCRDSVQEITLTCIGGKCKGRWRVDTVGADGAAGPAGPQGIQGQQGPQGPAGDMLTISSDCGEVVTGVTNGQIQCVPATTQATTQATTIVINSVPLVSDGPVTAECSESETLLAGGLTCTDESFIISPSLQPNLIIQPSEQDVTCILLLKPDSAGGPDVSACKCTAICGPSS